MRQLHVATLVRMGCIFDVWFLQALGGRIVAEGDDLHDLTLDADSRDLAPGGDAPSLDPGSLRPADAHPDYARSGVTSRSHPLPCVCPRSMADEEAYLGWARGEAAVRAGALR